LVKAFKKYFKKKNVMVPINEFRAHPVDAMKDKSLYKTRFRVAYCQSPGKERAHNEDTILTFSTDLIGDEPPTSFGLFLVADGMGGHQSGEIASRLAAQAASQHVVDKIFMTSSYDWNNLSDESLRTILSESVQQAQRLIRHQVPGGGTTLTMAMNLNETFYSAHVGDSRLYVLNKQSEMVLRTKDHSLVKRLVDLGEISEHEAVDHPQKNVLIRALGQIDPFEPDLDRFVLNVGEKIVICSDGLWGVVDELELFETIHSTADLNQAAAGLVQSANDQGGPDNISVVLVERLV